MSIKETRKKTLSKISTLINDLKSKNKNKVNLNNNLFSNFTSLNNKSKDQLAYLIDLVKVITTEVNGVENLLNSNINNLDRVENLIKTSLINYLIKTFPCDGILDVLDYEIPINSIDFFKSLLKEPNEEISFNSFLYKAIQEEGTHNWKNLLTINFTPNETFKIKINNRFLNKEKRIFVREFLNSFKFLHKQDLFTNSVNNITNIFNRNLSINDLNLLIKYKNKLKKLKERCDIENININDFSENGYLTDFSDDINIDAFVFSDINNLEEIKKSFSFYTCNELIIELNEDEFKKQNDILIKKLETLTKKSNFGENFITQSKNFITNSFYNSKNIDKSDKNFNSLSLSNFNISFIGDILLNFSEIVNDMTLSPQLFFSYQLISLINGSELIGFNDILNSNLLLSSYVETRKMVITNSVSFFKKEFNNILGEYSKLIFEEQTKKLQLALSTLTNLFNKINNIKPTNVDECQQLTNELFNLLKFIDIGNNISQIPLPLLFMSKFKSGMSSERANLALQEKLDNLNLTRVLPDGSTNINRDIAKAILDVVFDEIIENSKVLAVGVNPAIGPVDVSGIIL